MATGFKQEQAVKCLNTGGGHRRFVFKSFSQRVDEININVFRSLDNPIQSQPSDNSTFLRDALLYWRELNTAEDFISFYEQFMPLVQTLPQILLHKDKIFDDLVSRLNLKAKLSLEPILMLVANLSRDILQEFVLYLPRLVQSLFNLLKSGADRDPEIIELVFGSLCHIFMHLQKYLAKEVVNVLKITAPLRFYPKEFAQEFMAEAVSFLLRNSSSDHLEKGVRKVAIEVAKCPSEGKLTGDIALLWHAMRGTSSRLHSKADEIVLLLVDKSILSIGDKYPQAANSVLQVVSGALCRLCEVIDGDDLNLVFNFLVEKASSSVDGGCSVYLNRLLDILIQVIPHCSDKRPINIQALVELVQKLIKGYILTAYGSNLEDSTAETVDRIFQLMLCPLICHDISTILALYSPVFNSKSPYLLEFIRNIILKDPFKSHIAKDLDVANAFGTQIMVAMGELLECAKDEVIFLMLTFLDRQRDQQYGNFLKSGNNVMKICSFLESIFRSWAVLLVEVCAGSNHVEVGNSELAVLWGALSCYSYFEHHEVDLMSIRSLIDAFRQLLGIENEMTASVSKATWQSMLGAALFSYQSLLSDQRLRLSEISNFLQYAESYKSSPQVLFSVAEFLDSVILSKPEIHPSVSQCFDVQGTVVATGKFSDNLRHPNKAVRTATLRILSHYAPLERELPSGDECPRKKLNVDNSGSSSEYLQGNAIEIVLLVEMSPLSIMSRKNINLISKLHVGLSLAHFHEDYMAPLLNCMIGILHNRFSDLQQAATECIATLLRNYKDLSWHPFFEYLVMCQSSYISSDKMVKLSLEVSRPNSLEDCFNKFLSLDASDSTPCSTLLSLLLQSLQKASDVAESQSRHLLPLFMKFLGYADVDCESIELHDHGIKGKEWRSVLKEWLNLLRLMRNANSLYRSQALKEVLINRLLDVVDPDVQLKVLDCLLNWRDDFLIPYDHHLRNLVMSKNIREELTTWSVSKESQHISEDHRGHLIPLVVRLLTPKVRKHKALGSCKHTSVNHRRAIITFLAQLDVSELHLFFALLLKPLFSNFEKIAYFRALSDAPERISLMFQTFTREECSTLEAIGCLSWKKRFAFLYVIEDVFSIFDEPHIKPFLNGLMNNVVQILESCMSDILGAKSKETLDRDTSVKQYKDLRSLCLKIISSVLTKYECHDLDSHFWNTFFKSVKPLIENFKQEGSSSERPSSLFSCFIAMSCDPCLVLLFEREENLVPTIFSILTVQTASDPILAAVLSFAENLLELDNAMDNQENNPARRILLPNLDGLVTSLHGLFERLGDAKRKPVVSQLHVLKLLGKYITSSSAAEKFLDMLLSTFRKQASSLQYCLEALHLIKEILPVIGDRATKTVLTGVYPLLLSASGDMRSYIFDIIDVLASLDPSLSFLAQLMRKLNAISTLEIGEADYDVRITAYNSIRLDLFSALNKEQALVVLSQCVYDMSFEGQVLRESAYETLSSFIMFAAVVVNRVRVNVDNSTGVSIMDLAQETCINHVILTKNSIKKIIERIYVQSIGNSVRKDSTIHNMWLSLLRKMVYNLDGFSDLHSFKPLCDEDKNVDFFENIVDLKASDRRNALRRFTKFIKSEHFAESILMKIFVPLFFSMIFDVKDKKAEDLRNACLEALSATSGKVQWHSYQTILSRCMQEIVLKPDRKKILIRLVCAILDEFHFALNYNAPMLSSSQEASKIQCFLQKAVLPQIQKLLVSDDEKVNANISLAALKLLKLLPTDFLDSQLPSVIHHICNFQKSPLQSIRDDARSALAACVQELGLEYLHFIVKVLRAALKRGYELHVLGYTLGFVLSKVLRQPDFGKIDYCLEELFLIVETDILGEVAEQKEVGKFASKMKETKKAKSFETLELIARSVTFKTHVTKLLTPISAHLQKPIALNMKAKLKIMLLHIGTGVEQNPSAFSEDLFVFVYGLIGDTMKGGELLGDERLEASKRSANGNVYTAGSEHRNSHLITAFALELLDRRLKKCKLDESNEQLLAMLDPFVQLLVSCLGTRYEDVLSASFKCLAKLAKMHLPSLQSQAKRIMQLLFEIAQRSGNSSHQLVHSCLSLLNVFLKSKRLTLSHVQLHMLLQFPLFLDLHNSPSPIALSLLKSILDRKLIAPEIYDIVKQAAELMVTSQSDPIRKSCRQILLQFIQNYPISSRLLQEHIDSLVKNISYEHASGRESALEMLHAIIIRFSQTIVDSQAQTFFFKLVVALANEDDNDVHCMITMVVKELIGRSSSNAQKSMLEYSLSWYEGENRELWSVAAELLCLFVEVLKKGFYGHLHKILHVMRVILASSLGSSTSEEHKLYHKPAVPFYRGAYYSLVLFEKMLPRFSELYLDKKYVEFWGMICKFLLHPHLKLRNISGQLIDLYFTAASNEKSAVDPRTLAKETLFLINPSKLFLIAVSSLNQLKLQIIDEATSNLVTKNLVHSVCCLHCLIKKANTINVREYWSTVDPEEQSSLAEGFRLLGSRKSSEEFLLSATMVEASGETIQVVGNFNRDLRSLLVLPLIKMLGNIALRTGDIQTKIVLHSFRMISSQIGSEDCSNYGYDLLLPLYKIRQGHAGKVISAEICQLAESVHHDICGVLGGDRATWLDNLIRKNLREKGHKRKHWLNVMRIKHPIRHAKRKRRLADKHQAHKKRKIIALKERRG